MTKRSEAFRTLGESLETRIQGIDNDAQTVANAIHSLHTTSPNPALQNAKEAVRRANTVRGDYAELQQALGDAMEPVNNAPAGTEKDAALSALRTAQTHVNEIIAFRRIHRQRPTVWKRIGMWLGVPIAAAGIASSVESTLDRGDIIPFRNSPDKRAARVASQMEKVHDEQRKSLIESLSREADAKTSGIPGDIEIRKLEYAKMQVNPERVDGNIAKATITLPEDARKGVRTFTLHIEVYKEGVGTSDWVSIPQGKTATVHGQEVSFKRTSPDGSTFEVWGIPHPSSVRVKVEGHRTEPQRNIETLVENYTIL